MLKMFRRQFPPSILRSFSCVKVNKQTKKPNQKFFYKIKPNSCSLIQNCSFSGMCSPIITNIDYEHLKDFINDKDKLIIDVRNVEELTATGILPNSINIPLNELKTAFELAPEDFLNKYHITKPDKDQNIVFSCAKGVRSLKASHYLVDLGYKNVFNYTEGWSGWETHK